MVKSRKKMCFSLYPERFFKVFLPDQSSHQMKFPSAFLKHFIGIISLKSMISTTENSWKVDLKKISGNLYFHNGWERFVQDNSLQYGEFLVFSYHGNGKFFVKIYGRNGSEKDATRHMGQSSRGFPLPDDKKIDINRQFGLVECLPFKSDFPFFKIVMKPSYVTHDNVHVPTSFVKRHMKGDKEDVTFLSSDKSWHVKVLQYKVNNKRFTHGWFTFARDNGLKAGDVCVFESVERNEYVYKVSIFRCSDLEIVYSTLESSR